MRINHFPQLFFVIICLFMAGCKQSANNSAENKDHQVIADDRDPVLKDLTQKILSSPASASLYNERAKYYINNRKFDEAYEDLKMLFTLDSLSPGHYITLADYHIQNAEPVQAKMALEKGIIKNQGSTLLYLKLAKLFLYGRKYERSFENINKALKIDPYIAEAYFLKGFNYKELGKRDEAIASFRTAVEQDPSYYDAYMQLGLIHSEMNSKLAPDYFANALKAKPGSIEAHYARGMYYQENKIYKLALGDYSLILRVDSTNRDAIYNTGYVYHLQNNSKEAYKHFDKLTSIAPDEARVWYMRGLCLEEEGKKQEAISDYRKAVQVEPGFQPAEQGLKRLK